VTGRDGPVDDLLVVHLGSIDERLLEHLVQDDEVHGPPLSLARRRGSCTTYHCRLGSAPERLLEMVTSACVDP
jgi:hypothetical protein